MVASVVVDGLDSASAWSVRLRVPKAWMKAALSYYPYGLNEPQTWTLPSDGQATSAVEWLFAGAPPVQVQMDGGPVNVVWNTPGAGGTLSELALDIVGVADTGMDGPNKVNFTLEVWQGGSRIAGRMDGGPATDRFTLPGIPPDGGTRPLVVEFFLYTSFK